MRPTLALALALSAALIACSDSKPAAEASPEAEAPAREGEAPKTAEPPQEASTAAAPEDDANFELVNLAVAEDLPGLLAEHAGKAKAKGLRPYVELRADWCPPCKALEAAMDDPKIVAAFSGVYLIRLDSDAWGAKLGGTGLDSSAIPVFFELDEAGKVTGRKIDGGAWGEDTVENMAPPLDAFFHAKT